LKKREDDEEEQEAAIVVETEERPHTAILPTTPVSSLTGFKAHTHNSPPPESPKQTPRSQSLSHSPFFCSSFYFSSSSFFPLLPRRRRRASRISPAAASKEGAEGSVLVGIRTQALLMSCRDDDHWTVTLLGWSGLF
jgi:hypothetical protein